MDSLQLALRKAYLYSFGLLFLLGMHYLQFNFGGAGLQLPFNAMAWIFISALIGISCWQITLNQRIYISRFSLYFGVVVLLLCIPALYGVGEVVQFSVPRLMGLVAGWLLFVGLQQFRFRRKHYCIMLYLILGAVLIQALWGAVQYYMVGLWQLIPGATIGFFPGKMRPHGIFQQPNVMASFLVTGIAIAFYLVNRNRWHRHFWWARLLVYGVPLMGSLLLILNLSRTGFVACIVSLLLMLPMARKRNSNSAKKWLAMLLLGLLMALVTSQLSQQSGRSVDSITQPGVRLPTYIHCLEMFLQKPLLGWGYGGFEATFLSSSKQLGEQHAAIDFGNMDHPHNELLYWAVEGGILPLLALLVAAWVIFSLLYKARRIEGMALLAMLFPLLFHSMTEYPFYHAIIHWVVLMVLLAFIDNGYQQQRAVVWKPTFLLRSVAILLPVISAGFMLTTLHTTQLIGDFERGGFKDPEPLIQIINPVAYSTRVEWNALSFQLRHGLKLGELGIEPVSNYVEWAEQAVKHSPRPEIYHNWILGLFFLKDTSGAETVLAEASRLYPRFPAFINMKQRKLKAEQQRQLSVNSAAQAAAKTSAQQ